jgi:hypothetical protein
LRTIPIFGNQLHMDIAKSIIVKLGGVNGVSEKTGFPQQTVSAWICREPSEIPPWRRPVVAQIAGEAQQPLTKAELAYLASTKRTPKARAA